MQDFANFIHLLPQNYQNLNLSKVVKTSVRHIFVSLEITTSVDTSLSELTTRIINYSQPEVINLDCFYQTDASSGSLRTKHTVKHFAKKFKVVQF